MSSILVTGATGNIGRRVTAALLLAGHNVIGVSLDLQCTVTHERFVYHQLDIADFSAVDDFLAKNSVDTLIHLAALVHVRDSRLGFSDYSRMNFRASEHLFQKASSFGVSRVIFTSTVEVYGSVPSNQLVTEDVPCKPESDYARTKLLAEEALICAAGARNISYAILRLAPVYAGGFRLNLDKRLYLRAPTVGYYVSSGEYRLALCSVHNIEHFVTQWLRLDPTISGTFNLADERAYPVMDLLNRERQKGRCRVTLRLPYLPCLGAVAVLEAGLAIAGRQAKTFTVANIRKLIRSTDWDTSRASLAIGRLPWNLDNTPESN